MIDWQYANGICGLKVSDICPITLDGLNRLAKRIQKRDRVSYHVALELSAQQSGFPAYETAHKAWALEDEEYRDWKAGKRP